MCRYESAAETARGQRAGLEPKLLRIFFLVSSYKRLFLFFIFPPGYFFFFYFFFFSFFIFYFFLHLQKGRVCGASVPDKPLLETG